MRLHCCYTPAHEVLYRDWFRPSVPPGFDLRPLPLPGAGPGDFLSPEFLECIRRKLDGIGRSLREAPGDLMVWSDVDVVCFDLAPDRLAALAEGHDLLFQRETRRFLDVNAGFLVIRSNPRTIAFFDRVARQLAAHPEENEQRTINRLLFGLEVNNPPGRPLRVPRAELVWGYLPWSYAARTHGWPPRRNLAIYHANYTAGPGGVERKIAQFRALERIRRGGWPAWLRAWAGRIPERLFRPGS